MYPIRLWGLLTLSLITLGCQSGLVSPPGSQNQQNLPPPFMDGNIGFDPTNPDFWGAYPGDTVPLQVDDAQAWWQFSNVPLNWTQNIRLYVHLIESEPNCWDGWVMIGYQEGSQTRWAYFTSKHPLGYERVRVSYKNWYKNLRTCAFNQFFDYQGKRVFHGFFQDAYGAVVIVFDDILDTNDGYGATLSGQLYFKNFRQAPAPQYAGGDGEQCWFLLPPSPYECGTFKVGEKVVTTSALYPGDGYRRLGSFQGIRSRKALAR